MRIDIERIDQQIKKLQQLKTLASDNEFVELFQQYISNHNGNSSPLPIAQPKAAGVVQEYIPREGSFTEAVLVACRDFGVQSFTAREVVVRLEKKQFKMEAKNKYTAVLTILKKLVDHRLLKVVEATGRNPYVYANL